MPEYNPSPSPELEHWTLDHPVLGHWDVFVGLEDDLRAIDLGWPALESDDDDDESTEPSARSTAEGSTGAAKKELKKATSAEKSRKASASAEQSTIERRRKINSWIERHILNRLPGIVTNAPAGSRRGRFVEGLRRRVAAPPFSLLTLTGDSAMVRSALVSANASVSRPLKSGYYSGALISEHEAVAPASSTYPILSKGSRLVITRNFLGEIVSVDLNVKGIERPARTSVSPTHGKDGTPHSITQIAKATNETAARETTTNETAARETVAKENATKETAGSPHDADATPQATTSAAGVEDVKGLVPFTPPPGTPAAHRHKDFNDTPWKALAFPILSGMGQSAWAIGIFLFLAVIGPIVSRILNWLIDLLPDWELPRINIPWPDWHLPRIHIPWPDWHFHIPWPDWHLPSWMHFDIPDWLEFLLEHPKFWLPIFVALYFGIRQWRKFRTLKKEQEANGEAPLSNKMPPAPDGRDQAPRTVAPNTAQAPRTEAPEEVDDSAHATEKPDPEPVETDQSIDETSRNQR